MFSFGFVSFSTLWSQESWTHVIWYRHVTKTRHDRPCWWRIGSILTRLPYIKILNLTSWNARMKVLHNKTLRDVFLRNLQSYLTISFEYTLFTEWKAVYSNIIFLDMVHMIQHRNTLSSFSVLLQKNYKAFFKSFVLFTSQQIGCESPATVTRGLLQTPTYRTP